VLAPSPLDEMSPSKATFSAPPQRSPIANQEPMQLSPSPINRDPPKLAPSPLDFIEPPKPQSLPKHIPSALESIEPIRPNISAPTPTVVADPFSDATFNPDPSTFVPAAAPVISKPVAPSSPLPATNSTFVEAGTPPQAVNFAVAKPVD
jgi:hypothetical protein